MPERVTIEPMTGMQRSIPVRLRWEIRRRMQRLGYQCAWRWKYILRVWCPCDRGEQLRVWFSAHEAIYFRDPELMIGEFVGRATRAMRDHKEKARG